MRKVPSQAYYQSEMMAIVVLAQNHEGIKRYYLTKQTLQNI